MSENFYQSFRIYTSPNLSSFSFAILDKSNRKLESIIFMIDLLSLFLINNKLPLLLYYYFGFSLYRNIKINSL